jgi:Ca2+-binding RTX toxin-like protein
VAYAASDLSFLRIPGASSSFNDGLILIEGLGQIELSLQFYASGTSPVEQISFDNSDPTITLASQVFETRGTTGNDTICGITVNGFPQDILKGFEGNDTLYGLADDDLLYGGAGTDTLYGGDDDDMLAGGAGNDTLNGEGGTDTADYSVAAAGVTVKPGLGDCQQRRRRQGQLCPDCHPTGYHWSDRRSRT